MHAESKHPNDFRYHRTRAVKSRCGQGRGNFGEMNRDKNYGRVLHMHFFLSRNTSIVAAKN